MLFSVVMSKKELYVYYDIYDIMVQGNMLQIIIFALFMGIAIALIRKKAESVYNFFDGLAEVMYRLTAMIMNYAPIGVFALIAAVVGSYGLDVLLPLAKVIIAVPLQFRWRPGLP
ncbi:MAG: cation:dicarboxylase symporter family transporter [Firmicutes bacterium]|nr:cation:dicarboxylase symporter family transporter [Bacillota bacterium]